LRATIVPHLQGLEEITGWAVILDIFRASNTMISLISHGASRVWPVAEVNRALALKAAHPQRLLWGERGGLALPGFEGGNSPAAAGPELAGREVILTTSAGTQAAHRLARAAGAAVGSFANASALSARLREAGAGEVALLPMGLEARAPAEEDQAAAEYLALALTGHPPEFEPYRRRLLASDGAARLRRLGQEDDLALCTALDTHQAVPRVEPGDPPAARAWFG
jgi:2-phosphosulfolactate phosphatase